jgi:Fe-S cluster assembly protein SufD
MSSNLNQTLIKKFEQFEASLNGEASSSLHGIRRQGIKAFDQIGLPSAKHEEYKFTNLGKILEKKFDWIAPHHSGGEIDINTLSAFQIPNLEAYRIVFINGVYAESLSDHDTEQVTITELQKASESHEEVFDKHFGQHAVYVDDAFAALNTAFVKNGSFIKVEKNVVVDKPIVIYNLSDASANESVNYPRNLILAGISSQVSIVEIFGTIGSHNSLVNTVTEIAMEENAIVDYHKIGNDSEKAYHVGLTQVHQASNSTFNANTIAFGGGMIRNNLHIKSAGEGCNSNMYGLYLLDGKSHVDNHTVVDHIKPNSESNELYKGILDGQSKGVFNGKVFVRSEAQKTNAFQSNKNILLTDDATVNTKPQLEIWADDVKCSHGCTTGQLDLEALFYLQARGISKDKAKAMLLYAFAIDVLEHIKIEALKEHLDHIIAKRFNQEF